MKIKNLTPFLYETYCRCPKYAWLSAYNLDQVEVNTTLKNASLVKSEIYKHLKSVNKDAISALSRNEDYSYNFREMAECTQAFVSEHSTIMSATCCLDGNYAMVDILERCPSGYVIYDIKPVTMEKGNIDMKKLKTEFTRMAYNKYIFKQCGFNIIDCKVICFNYAYILGDELNFDELLLSVSIDEEINEEYCIVPSNIGPANKILAGECPDCGLAARCKGDSPCLFMNYCMKAIPENSVFDLYRILFKTAAKVYAAGGKTFKDLNESSNNYGIKLNDIQRIQIDSILNNKPVIDLLGIHAFCSKLHYPLYFLDFEAFTTPIPVYRGTRAYQQIPFQYSLHYIEYENGPLMHKEFLADDDSADPRRTLVERLCADIPVNSCIVAYNKLYECARLKEFAEIYHDLSEHLLNIRDNVVDLMEPFVNGYYYVPAMHKSFSLKSVLPALFPDDPELNYSNLEGEVHNGMDAMTLFPTLKTITADDVKQGIREQLLKYCELDTYALVKIFWRFKELLKDYKPLMED